MSDQISPTYKQLNHAFTAPIGVDVKGSMWQCVEMPGSADFFGTKNQSVPM
jgi:hypothetical protein